jgi:diguanylate cyclase (GGDEF)-like protein
VFLFKEDPGAGHMRPGRATFAGLLVLTCLAGFICLRSWVASRVVRPLRSLAGPIPTGFEECTQDLPYETGGWRETESVAARLRELIRGLAEGDAAVRRARFDSQRWLRSRERGFDVRLRRAEDRAMLDPLTGLRNRSYLEANLSQIVAEQREKGQDLSVVMIDLDNFKPLNDNYGHSAGDDMLRCTGELLRATIRPSDHAIRYGGDEFLLLLPGVDIAQAQQITERILKLFVQSASLIDVSRAVTLSAGVASRRSDGCDDGWALITRADDALYAAKRAGKNTVALSPAG